MLAAQALSISLTGLAIAAVLGLAAAAACHVRTFLQPKQTEALQTNVHGQGDAYSLHYYMIFILAMREIVAALDSLVAELNGYCAILVNLFLHDQCEINFLLPEMLL